MKEICIKVDDFLYSKIKEKCEQTGYSQEFFFREAIEKHLGLIGDLLLAQKILQEELKV